MSSSAASYVTVGRATCCQCRSSSRSCR
jgi:hypothetical protein